MFGLNFTTTESDLDREFRRYGKIEKVQVVLDGPTKRSRGFAFIYFETEEDAEKARDAMNGTEISGFKIRVDYSITNHAHKPTPGVYFHHGKATRPGFRLREGRRGGRGGDYRDRYHERDRYYEDRERERDRYHERRPPPSYYDRAYDYGGPPRHRDERYYDHHRDPRDRDRERERYYEENRYREDRYREERYRDDRYRDERYERPPRDYYEKDRYERYPPSHHHYSSSSRRSGSPPSHHSRRDY